MRENKVSAFENLNNYHHFLIFKRKRLHFIFKTNFHVLFNDHLYFFMFIETSIDNDNTRKQNW